MSRTRRTVAAALAAVVGTGLLGTVATPARAAGGGVVLSEIHYHAG